MKSSDVVIVGRANVGKSTLFNRLSTSVKSLTFEHAGVTRDFIKDHVCWKDRCFELIDTGGVSFKKTDDMILEKTRALAELMVKQAGLVIFVCDGSVGILPEDQAIAKMLHKLGKKTIVVINKIDTKLAQEHLYEFPKLGFDSIVEVSAQHARGIGDLLDAIVEELPEKETEEDQEQPRYSVVLLGKPNVGKSSLLNQLLKRERAIVTDIPGTTREPLAERIAFYKEQIQLVDTPGIRRKRAVEEPIETLMVKSALRAVEGADIVLLLIDASQVALADQEIKLAFYTFTELYKALILLFNKQDLVDETMREQLDFALKEYDFFLKKVVRLDISCKTGSNIGKIMPLVQKVWDRYSTQFSDEELNLLFKDALRKKPLYHKTVLLRLYSAKQVRTAPITILLVVNVAGWFGPSQLGFFENILRKKFELRGVPIRFIVRSKKDVR